MKANRVARVIGKTALWISGIWLGLMLLVQIVLSTPVLTKVINSLAGDYIDGHVSFGKASVSIFSHFPRITLNLEDVELTYPHDRFDSQEKKSMQGILLYRGCGETADTLASFRRLSASISLLSLASGEIKLPHIEIDSPKIFAHYYDEEHMNWDIFISPEESRNQSDTTDVDDEDGMNIILKRLDITGEPKIVYTDSKDSLYALISMKRLSFDGHFETGALHRTAADAEIDSVFIAGRYGKDTLALGLERLHLSDMDAHMHMEVRARTFMATETFGRMTVPVVINTDLALPEDTGAAVSLRNITAEIAAIPVTGYLDARMREDRIMTEGHIEIPGCRIQNVLQQYLSKFIPELADVRTDTEVSAEAMIRGSYGYEDGSMPEVRASIDVPDSEIDYKNFPERIILGLNASFLMDTTGMMHAEVSKARLRTFGLDMNARLGISDITGKDPEIKANGRLRASLDSLKRFLPDTMNISACGSMTAEFDGTLNMSHLDLYEFSKADIDGSVKGSGIILQMPGDTIDMRVDGINLRLAPEQMTSRRDPSRTFRLMGVTGTMASADINYKDALVFKGKNIEFRAKNSTTEEQEDQQDISYLGGRFNAEMLQLNDSQGTSIKLDNTRNSFQMRPKTGQPTIPVLSLKNKNLRITYVTADNRVILTDSEISAEAAMNTLDRERRREAYLDSLAKVYPDIPRDSIFRHMRLQRAGNPVPSWMAEDDFRSSDIKVNLNETFRKYYREWDLKGNAGIRTGIVMTPYLPLRNILRGASLSITNNRISIDSLKIISGESEISAKGSLDGLRRAMLRNGSIQMDLDISSSSVNADELLRAYSMGSHYKPAERATSTEMSNAEFFKQVTADTVTTEQRAAAIFVIPGNVNADLDINVSGIRYKDLDISSFKADMVVKERCAQLTNTSMRSNIGSFDLDAFYVTRSKQDIRAGFCLDVKDMTSERFIGLAPEIGEIIPMVGSIKGLLNCEIAATASLDTTMNIIMPSVNGIVRMSGKDLSITDDEIFTSVAKTLMFRDKRKGEIDNLMLEGTIKDNVIEIFPFILKVDRYTLGLSGIQNMDMSYRHHVSVLRSPLLIRVGLNISGPDYDHMKFRLGKALYRARKMPSFTAVIDQTKNDLRYAIYNIFDTGVDQTIENRDIHSTISRHQDNIGYVNAAMMEMEDLSKEDTNRLEDGEAADAVIEKAMAAGVKAVQKALKNK